MMKLIDQLSKAVATTVADGISEKEVKWEHPEKEGFGDYSTNLALIRKGGRPMAEKITKAIEIVPGVKAVRIEGPGFVNFDLADEVFEKNLDEIIRLNEEYGRGDSRSGQRIMVEYAHPNTHKEMHIGHMRTLVTGESVARLLAANGAEVFRANYQGDIGPHVAKAVWGTERILWDRKMSWEEAEQLSLADRAHLLGEGYVLGNEKYEENKKEIDKLNKELYEKNSDKSSIYQRTRQWSLDYYKSFYERFGTKFDRLFFESEVAEKGKSLVNANIGKVFDKSDGAVIFDGEKYGLHKRVFVTSDGNPTYEGKEMGLAYLQRDTFAFDKCIHVVANEQLGYFAVVIKALGILDTSFVGKEFHLTMGMVNLVGRKISSRTGVVLTVDSLISEIKALARDLIKPEGKNELEVEEISEAVTLAAIKYSVLKANPELNVTFDLKQSVSLEGSSGPYLQYTYARCRSVISKSGNGEDLRNLASESWCNLAKEEISVVRWLYRYPEVVEEAGNRLCPNLLATYLHELAGRFNTFYNQHSIISADKESQKIFRLRLTLGTAQVLKNGMGILGVTALGRM